MVIDSVMLPILKLMKFCTKMEKEITPKAKNN
jgi:hypothetical protein